MSGGGIGGALQEALGLGLAGARSLGEGLGIVQPATQPGMFGAPAQAQQEDLGDLNPLQQLSLRFQNAVESAEGNGTAVASGGLRNRRAAGNQKRLEAFSQGTKMLEDFDAIRDRARPGDYDRIDGLLKRRFGDLAGGQPGQADEMYDTFMSGRGLTPGMLALMQSDPGAQQLLAGGASIGELRQYLTSPEMIAKAHELADQKALPGARNKLDAALKSGGGSPEVRAELERRIKKAGGRPTLAIMRDMADQLPPEMQPTENEWAALERNELEQGDIGLQASPELLKRRDQGHTSQLNREEKSAELSQQHRNAMELQRLKNDGALNAAKNRKSPGSDRILQHQWEAARYGKRMDESNRIFEKLHADGFERESTSAAAESLLPNVMRSTQRQQQEQAEEDFVGAILRDESGATITANETLKARKKYFPQHGDSKETVAQKAASRTHEVEQMRRQAAKAWDEGAPAPTATAGPTPPAMAPAAEPAAAPYAAPSNAKPDRLQGGFRYTWDMNAGKYVLAGKRVTGKRVTQ